jgi:CMP-N,N'-diacetyllegionaminic acid synthase
LLHNVPLIGYTIRAAQSAVGLTDFVVSTEDEEIKALAYSYGATVVDRPANLAGDDVTSGAVVRHALDVMEGRPRDEPYDIIVLLHPTSPIRDPKHIDQAIKQLSDSCLDTLASAVRLPKKSHPNIFDENGDFLHGDAFMFNASIYAMKRDWMIQNPDRHCDEYGEIFEMDRRHSVDIDTEIDFKIAELFLNG